MTSTGGGLPNLERQLGKLLDFLKFWEQDQFTNAPRLSAPEGRERNGRLTQVVDSQQNPLGIFKWLKSNERHTRSTEREVRAAGQEFQQGNVDAFFERLRRIDLSWLRMPNLSRETDGGSPNGSRGRGSSNPLTTAPTATPARTAALREVVLNVAATVCPWDYDRKEPSVTFVNIWENAGSIVRDGEVSPVKVTSTIKPLYREWKLSARSKLSSLGEDGVLFGKAGLYLVGDSDPYVGVEADRTWRLQRIAGGRVFANANYRSSRRPESDPVVLSAGWQQKFRISDGLDMTVRFGIRAQGGTLNAFFCPIPFGSYF